MISATTPGRGIGWALVDDGLAWVLAALAAAGSFTHIRDLAIRSGQHGWMADAIAVCIDLMCVMAVRERKRDQRLGRRCGRVSWPTVVLTLGVCLTIAANLASAQQTPWGWIMAATPAATFLIAVSMLERRAAFPGRVSKRRASAYASGTKQVHTRRTRHADPERPAGPQAPREADSLEGSAHRLMVRPTSRSRSPEIESRARTVLAQRPGITGADLGRTLGVTERHGRRLRKRLGPLGT
jgi:hypothetical protein